MTRGEKAEELFRSGCNCAQAVLGAFSDLTGLEKETAIKISAPFGGGMGKLREVCGTVSGALMVLGLLCASTDPGNHGEKTALYGSVQEYAARFREKEGSIICRELLKNVKTDPSPHPEERTDAYYHRRPCGQTVHDAADLLEELLKEKGVLS